MQFKQALVLVCFYFFPFFWNLLYFIFYCFKFVYMRRACSELLLLPLHEWTLASHKVFRNTGDQNTAHLNNYIFEPQYINIAQNAIRSTSQEQPKIILPWNTLLDQSLWLNKEEHVIEKRIYVMIVLSNKRNIYSFILLLSLFWYL